MSEGNVEMYTYSLVAMCLIAIVVFPGNDLLVVECERLLRSPRLLVELPVGHTVCDERERLFVEVQNTTRIMCKRIVQFLVFNLFVHVISPRTI